ncbi:MAG: hypothetical protein ACPGVB_04970 [Chitinophagales bacterium]
MKVNFLLLIILSITIIACSDKFNDAKDLCFIDVSVVNDDIAFPHHPVSVCKMTETTAWIWSLSFFGDNGNCRHYSYHNSFQNKHFSYNADTILPWSISYDNSHPKTGLALIIDTTQSYGITADRHHLPSNLHIDADFYQAIKVNHPEKYPPISTVAFYIINRQTYGIPIIMSSYIPILIQEAIDSSRRWKPIEYIGVGGCGNSGHITKLPSNSYLTGSVLKYTGNYETYLRLKLKVGEHILYSTPYKGKINFEQFEIIERHKEMMEKDRYGATIFESLFLYPRRICKEYW